MAFWFLQLASDLHYWFQQGVNALLMFIITFVIICPLVHLSAGKFQEADMLFLFYGIIGF